jgi:hypothetical protein
MFKQRKNEISAKFIFQNYTSFGEERVRVRDSIILMLTC